MRDDDPAWQFARVRCRPRLDGRPQLGRAVSVSIEEDEYRATLRLQKRQPDGPFHSGLLHELPPWHSYRSTDTDAPGSSFRDQTAQQHRERRHLPMAFHYRLDLHLSWS